MFSTFFSRHMVRRSFALAVFAGAGLAAAGAQTEAGTGASAKSVPSLAVQPLHFQTTAVSPLGDGPGTYSSSSSQESYDPTAAAQIQLASLEKGMSFPGANAMQYGQRRRYGAPRYRGGNTNADGSEKYTGYVGGGFSLPVGTNTNYLTTSWGLQAGAGRNFNKNLGVNLEFDYDHFGMTADTINNQAILYDPNNVNGVQGNLDANSHIWSLSLQPTYQIYSGQGLGAYVTAGVGFYHKVANFTLPQQQQACDIYYGCFIYTANANVDHYTSNAPGFDGGLGLTYKFSRFANQRLYAEVRYVYMNNQYRPGITPATLLTYTGYNYFPQNSNTTSYIPVKFGIRF